jgi:propionyl-CoA carboxylase alpha chain
MRVVWDQSQLEDGLRAARGEAITAFNSDEVFVEKYVLGPRHIELQIVADEHGNVAVLGERECSIQRRHQKVVEESPSVAVDDTLRQKMFESAERLVRGANYTNAGTLEFLLDEKGDFYFLEVNTRLQVEHPVTELVTGVDLVEMQLLVASGQQLPISTDSIQRRGHAIECRVCAEDVFNDFLPSIGTIREVIEPTGDGIRVDSALYAGMPVTLYYDPMVAKIITWGENRTEAIARMLQALDSTHIAGIATTIPFCQFVLEHPAFISGNFSTNFVKEHWSPELLQMDSSLIEVAAASASAVRRALKERFMHK